MNYERPKNLNLFTIHFPMPSIVSICHRISGFFLFLAIPILLWGLNYSFNPDGFATMQQWMAQPAFKFFLWLILIPLCFHLVAGIRHLLMDLNFAVSFRSGWLTAVLVFIISALLVALLGIWLW